jgi:hypothetical protein
MRNANRIFLRKMNYLENTNVKCEQVKKSLCLIKCGVLKTYEGLEV